MQFYRDFAFALNPGGNRWFVRSAGACLLGPEYREPVKTADFAEIFWCVDGKCEFELNGPPRILERGSFWYYPPGSIHRLRIIPPFFQYYWLTFEGPGIGALFHGLNIEPGINYAGDCPEEIFTEIIRDIAKNDDAVRRNVLTDGLRILVQAGGRRAGERGSPSMEEARNRIENQFRSAGLTAESLAESLGMHRVSLSRAFSAHFGMTVSSCLRSKRIQEAIRLLQTTDLPLDEIAVRSGFATADYLSKAVRKSTGMRPSEMRRMHS